MQGGQIIWVCSFSPQISLDLCAMICYLLYHSNMSKRLSLLFQSFFCLQQWVLNFYHSRSFLCRTRGCKILAGDFQCFMRLVNQHWQAKLHIVAIFTVPVNIYQLTAETLQLKMACNCNPCCTKHNAAIFNCFNGKLNGTK